MQTLCPHGIWTGPGRDCSWCNRIELEREKLRAESAERQLQETREALAGLIDWADNKRGADFGEREWADARRAVSPADTTEGT